MKNSEKILKRLTENGYEAYYVGGCVRDMLMGKKPHDTDITTNALPEKIMSLFGDFHVIPTGLKHGTVTVMDEGVPYEITTYRVDGEYSDGRRPDKVSFSTSLTEDLARRDFTMNAIAMDAEGNIIDPFGGEADIRSRIIRCVGNPTKRFEEDALRIMRCIRFASQLGFEISSETENAVHSMKERLELISKERIRDELDKLLCGEDCTKILLEYSDVLSVIIPEIKPCIGFEQHSDFHRYTVWEHIARAVGSVPKEELTVRRALLFHDISKPACYHLDEQGKGHFKGHAAVGALDTAAIMTGLKYDKKSIVETGVLIRHHSDKLRNVTQMKKIISVIGERLFFLLVKMKNGDNSAKCDFVKKEIAEMAENVQKVREFLDAGGCCTLQRLAVNGNDMEELGIKGRETGDALNELLELVIEEKLPNNKDDLVNYIIGRQI